MEKKSDFNEEIIPNTEGQIISVSMAEYPHGGLIFGYISEYTGLDKSKIYRIGVITLNYLSGAFSKPSYIYNSNMKLDNLILYLNQFGVLMLFFNEIESSFLSKIFMMKSNDYAKSWETKKAICEDLEGWYISKRLGRMLPDQLILPLYHPKFFRSMMVITADNFKTYSYSNCIEPACDDDDLTLDDEIGSETERPKEPIEGTIKPIVFQVEPNSLLGYVIGKKDKRILVSDSHDFGYTWTEPTPISMSLISGEYDILTIYDQYKETSTPKIGLLALVEKFRTEASLGLYRATQFPDHWSTFKYLEKGQNQKITCPYLIETLNDEIHLVYILNGNEIKHVYFKKEII